MTVNRTLAAGLAFLLTLAARAAPPSGAPTPKLTLPQLRELRRTLARRPRRIIANNDGCDCLYFPKDHEATPQAFLDARTTALADTQVGAIAYCTISSGFGNFTHNTAAGAVLTRHPYDYGIAPTKRNITQELISQGADCLQLVLGYAHEHDIEVLWSMRMNDTHDVAHRPEKPYLLFPLLKEQHPEWLVGNHLQRTPYGRWSSMDYAVPEVRQLAFAFVEEVCRKYDVDGVELDFFRHLCYFRSVALGGTATAAECDQMTELMQRIRTMTEQVGLDRGRPVLVAVRVPDSVGYCRDIGLDLERWLQEGLADILITTCYFRLNPWSYSVALGHKYGAVVYPCLSDSRVKGETRFRRASLQSYRGRAMNAWAAGADGIHLFNYFNPRAQVWRELGDTETLRTADKLYFATVRDGNPNGFLANGVRHRTAPVLTPLRPKSVPQDGPLKLSIDIGDDLAKARAEGHAPQVRCHVRAPGTNSPDELAVRFNGELLSGGGVSEGWIDCPAPAELVKRGANAVEISVARIPVPAPGEWSFEYTGDAKPPPPWTRDPGSPRTEEKLGDGALFIADRGTVAGDYHYYRFPWGAETSGPITVEARVKVVSGSSFVIVADARAGERLRLLPDHIDLLHHSNLRHEMDTTDDFHLYRITIEGEDLRVYVDDELRIDAPGTFKPRGGYPRNELAFGAANSGWQGEAYWDFVRARLERQTRTCTGSGARTVLLSSTAAAARSRRTRNQRIISLIGEVILHNR